MTTRIVTNSGSPLYDPEGNVLSGVQVSFELVDCAQRPVSVRDAVSNDVISGTVIVSTDSTGVFSAPLWPTSKGQTPSQYLCQIGAVNAAPFLIQVPDLSGSLSIFDAMTVGGLPPC